MPVTTQSVPTRSLRLAVKRVTDSTLALEDKLTAELDKIFQQAARIAAVKFRRTATSLTAADWSEPHPDELVDVEALAAKLRTKSDPIRQSAINEYGQELDQLGREAGVPINWDIHDPMVERALAGAGQHVTHIADTTRLNVMRSIRQAYEQGLSIPDTAKLIQAGMETAGPARARLIARTELTAVANGGALAATQVVADATGTTYYKRWLTAPGATYPRHEDYEGLDGQTQALDDVFEVGNALLQHPGDPDGPPEEICNCRCSMVFVTTADESVPFEEQPFIEGARSWGGFPFNVQTGQVAKEIDTPPERTSNGDFVLYHGTSKAGVESIPKEGIKPDDLGVVGVTTIPGQAQPFAAMKGGEVMRLVVDKDWLAKQSISREIGGSGHDQFLIQASDATVRQRRRFAGVPASAIKEATVFDFETATDAERFGAQIGITPFKAGTEIDPGNTLYAVLKEHPNVLLDNTFMSPAVGEPAAIRLDSITSLGIATGDPEKALVVNRALNDVVRFADLKGYDVFASPTLAFYGFDTEVYDAMRYWFEDHGFVENHTLAGDLVRHPDPTLKGQTIRVGGDNVIGFYDSPKYVQFQNDVRQAADHYGVSLDAQQRAEGIWQGQTEPSVALNVHDGETAVRAFAADIGKAYNQDAVLLFTPARSGDLVATFDATADRDKVLAAMEQRFPGGGRFLADGRLQIIGTGPGFVGQLDRLAETLGVDYDVEQGTLILLERDQGDYAKAIAEWQRSQQTGVIADPSASLPASIDESRTPLTVLSGGINDVYIARDGADRIVIKPEPTPERYIAKGRDDPRDFPIREMIKFGNDLGRERAAYDMARIFNSVDPEHFHVNTPAYRVADVKLEDGTTTRAGVSEFLENMTEARDLYSAWRGMISDEELRSAALYDAIIGNTDRHAGNFMFGPDDHVWLIDHGLAFPDYNSDLADVNMRLVEQRTSRFRSDTLTAAEVAFLEKLLTMWPEIEPTLTAELGPDVTRLTRERVQAMLDENRLLPTFGGHYAF